MGSIGIGAWNGTMKVIMDKLGDMLMQEYTLVIGVHGDIQYINDELASMRAFIDKLNRGDDNHDEQVRDWVRQVQDVAYDIEDCIDNVSYRLGREPLKDDHMDCLRKVWHAFVTLRARHDVASEIQKLKLRAKDVGERRARYGVKDPSGSEIKPDGSRPSYHATERAQPGPQLVDVIEPARMMAHINDLGKWLIDGGRQDYQQQRILAVVGIDSLGKTTLALALYNRFGAKFDCRASVHASQKYDRAALLRSMLTQFMPQVPDQDQQGDSQRRRERGLLGALLHPRLKIPGSTSGGGASGNPLEGIEGWKERQIQEKLETYLAEKRYFLLIDDIWSASAWEDIRKCLPKNTNHSGPGGAIVVTTRFKSVAEVCCRQVGHIHTLKKLTPEESKRLLFERIFGTDDPPPESDESKKAIEEIVKKCGGLPLAIVAVAGLLASKLTRESQSDSKSKPPLKLDSRRWEEVSSSLSSELEKNPSPESLTQILNVCCNDFPADQKPCLLYLSIFPKGCNISRKRLIRRWIAEGFITEKHGNTAEEVAEECFNELINRSIIRCVDSSSNGKAKTCQVHDMILEYIVSKSSEENFTTVVGGHWLTPTPRDRVRRLSIHSIDREHAKTAMHGLRLSHVRSLSAFESLKQLTHFSFKFRILQMLDLEGCKGLSNRRLKRICEMFHLKYLSLRKTDIKKLPPGIGKLQYLEMLDIRETNVRELPTSVEFLKRLAHLLCGNKRKRLAVRLAQWITKMIALQTLSGIEICRSSSEALADIHNLTKVKKLSIYNLKEFGEDNKLRSAIEYMSSSSLVSLAIDDGFTGFLDSLINLSAPPKYLRALELSGKLCVIPKWISDLDQLTKLVLSLTSLSTDALRIVGKLDTLFSLTFSLHASKLDKDVLKTLQKNTEESGGEIFVPAEYREDGQTKALFPSLKLLRFSTPVLPLLSFQTKAMPRLQRLELRFRTLEGVYGLENLDSLQQVYFGVSRWAPQAAKEKMSQIKTSVSNHPNRPTAIDDGYYE